MKKIPQKKASDKKGRKGSLKLKSDIESTKSTLAKMNEFLSDHNLSSNLSVDSTNLITESAIQPIASASFPLDYSEMQERVKQEAVKPKISEITKALENKRSDFEEIRAHLERRSEEMKKRMKKMGINKPNSKPADDKSLTLSYYSTEFSLDTDTEIVKPRESLTNWERLKLISDKLNGKDFEAKIESKSRESVQQPTHAIFEHLAKLKSKSVFKLDPPKIKKNKLGTNNSLSFKQYSKVKSNEFKSYSSQPNLTLRRGSLKQCSKVKSNQFKSYSLPPNPTLRRGSLKRYSKVKSNEFKSYSSQPNLKSKSRHVSSKSITSENTKRRK